MIAMLVYVLCFITSLACAWLLWRGYRRSGVRLLFWSSACFAGLALNNLLLVVDTRVGPALDLSVVRVIPAVIGATLLLFGLVWESRG